MRVLRMRVVVWALAAATLFVCQLSAIAATQQSLVSVDAGSDQTIAWPANSVKLDGHAFDEHLQDWPEVEWQQVSGPDVAQFDTLYLTHTTVRFPAPGTYVVRLVATRAGTPIGSDDITVDVRSGSVGDAAPVADKRDAVDAGDAKHVATTVESPMSSPAEPAPTPVDISSADRATTDQPAAPAPIVAATGPTLPLAQSAMPMAVDDHAVAQPPAPIASSDGPKAPLESSATSSAPATESPVAPAADATPLIAKDLEVSTTVGHAVAVQFSAAGSASLPLFYQVIAPPSVGALNGDGQMVTYTPNAGYVGGDSFTYQAMDDQRASNIATVRVRVEPNEASTAAENAPVGEVASESATGMASSGQPTSLVVTINDPMGRPASGATVSIEAEGVKQTQATENGIAVFSTDADILPVELIGKTVAITAHADGFREARSAQNPMIAAGQQTAVALQLADTKAAAPTFNPPAGNFAQPIIVTLATATAEAQIRYTLDGSEPTDNSPLYVDPIAVSAATVIMARAVCSGYDGSDLGHASYTIGSSTSDSAASATSAPPSSRFVVQPVGTPPDLPDPSIGPAHPAATAPTPESTAVQAAGHKPSESVVSRNR